MDTRIGVLNSGKCYAFVNGYDKPEVQGTLIEIEMALGLRCAVSKVCQTPKPSNRTYAVTVTPSIVTWAGLIRCGEYTVTVSAKTASEAVSKARRMRRDEEGRFAVSATYRASLAAAS